MNAEPFANRTSPAAARPAARPPGNKQLRDWKQRHDWVRAATPLLEPGTHVSPSTMRSVLLYLTWERGNNAGGSWPKSETIANDLRLSTNQARRAVTALVEQGFVTRTRRRNERGWLGPYEYLIQFDRVDVGTVAGDDDVLDDQLDEAQADEVEVEVEVDEVLLPATTVVPRDSPTHHDGATKPPPWVPTSHHRDGAEPAIENQSTNSSEQAGPRWTLTRRAAELEVKDRNARGRPTGPAVIDLVQDDYLRERGSLIDELLRCDDLDLDTRAEYLRRNTKPGPARPPLYVAPPDERCSREEMLAALDAARRDTITGDEVLTNLDRVASTTQLVASRFPVDDHKPARER